MGREARALYRGDGGGGGGVEGLERMEKSRDFPSGLENLTFSQWSAQ
jgi:hypothetical protein